MTDLDLTADALVMTALREDPHGAALLVRDLDAMQLRMLATRLAARASANLLSWGDALGISDDEAIRRWQTAMMRRAADQD
jgi:hypothetical protein